MRHLKASSALKIESPIPPPIFLSSILLLLLVTCYLEVKRGKCNGKGLEWRYWPLHVHSILIPRHLAKLQYHCFLVIRIHQLKILHRCHGNAAIEVKYVRTNLVKVVYND